MRGKDVFICSHDVNARITPAYAGKSGELYVLFKSIQDHPRLCGEKCTPKLTFTIFEGSPPPMRGKEYAQATPPIIKRITPAYAGKRVSKV